MHPVQAPVRQTAQAPSSCFDPIASHVKQYWPAWIYKAAFAGSAVGQYVLNRWDIAAGFAGAGLVTMYVISYFSRVDEPQGIPRPILEYEAQNRENIQNLIEVGSELLEANNDLTKELDEMESGIKEEKENDLLAQTLRSSLTAFVQDEEKKGEDLAVTSTGEQKINDQLHTLEQGESEQIEQLNRSNQRLTKVLSEAEMFLHKREEKPYAST